MEALTKVSKLFTKIAAAKQLATAGKEHQKRLREKTPTQITTHLPRVDVPPPRVDKPSPRMAEPPVEQAPATCSHSRSPLGGVHSSAAWPNYISQDKEDHNDPPQQRTTRSATQNNMQEAMFWEMANVVIGEEGEPLEYKKLIANPKTQVT